MYIKVHCYRIFFFFILKQVVHIYDITCELFFFEIIFFYHSFLSESRHRYAFKKSISHLILKHVCMTSHMHVPPESVQRRKEFSKAEMSLWNYFKRDILKFD